jgi:hypothetical protein
VKAFEDTELEQAMCLKKEFAFLEKGIRKKRTE